MAKDITVPVEGDLYMSLTLHGYTFDLRYGYYEEKDRNCGEPVVIYPDLKSRPLYDSEGFLLVTAIQEPCEFYMAADEEQNEHCCSDCIYYPNSRDEISVCICQARRKRINNGSKEFKDENYLYRKESERSIEDEEDA